MNGVGRGQSRLSAAFVAGLSLLCMSAARASDAPEPAIDRSTYVESPEQRANALTASPRSLDWLPRGFSAAGLMEAGASDRLLAEMDFVSPW